MAEQFIRTPLFFCIAMAIFCFGTAWLTRMEVKMSSCWIIKLRDGTIKFYTEQEYRRYYRESRENVLVEEHWFDVTKAKDTYRDKLYKSKGEY